MSTSAAWIADGSIELRKSTGAAIRRRTVQAIRPETIERATAGAPGVVLGGKYRLERPIATGGMASIWSATHVTLNRPVAVKFVDARMGADPRTRLERFVREAKVAASVRHKNVVDILDFGVLDDGGASPEPYMIMELLDGEALDLRMRREPLSTSEAVNVIRQVLSGLEAVHAAGIVHRDLKPGNVFLTEDADGTFARVLDFGISQELDAHDGAVIGTPEYMSPEQALGDPVDPRSDVYAVGVMLYELLAGYLPFDHPDAARVLELVVAAKPLPLAAARPDVPELCAVAHKAMSRDAGARYADARQMRDALMKATGATSGSGPHRVRVPPHHAQARGTAITLLAPLTAPAPVVETSEPTLVDAPITLPPARPGGNRRTIAAACIAAASLLAAASWLAHPGVPVAASAPVTAVPAAPPAAVVAPSPIAAAPAPAPAPVDARAALPASPPAASLSIPSRPSPLPARPPPRRPHSHREITRELDF